MIQWFYEHGDKVEGPVDGATFNALQAKGVIYQTTLVIQAGMLEWVPLCKVMKTRQMIPLVGGPVPGTNPETAPETIAESEPAPEGMPALA